MAKKQEVKNKKLELVKKQMVDIIKEMPMPILYCRQEADGDYTLGVLSAMNVITIGYAEDFLNKQTVSLDELDVCDLSGIIVYGEKMTKQAILKLKEGDFEDDQEDKSDGV